MYRGIYVYVPISMNTIQFYTVYVRMKYIKRKIRTFKLGQWFLFYPRFIDNR